MGLNRALIVLPHWLTLCLPAQDLFVRKRAATKGKQARGRWYHTCLRAKACPRVRIAQSNSRSRWCCGECSAQACGLTASSVRVLMERSSSGTSTDEQSVSRISATGPAHCAGATSYGHRTGLRAGAWTRRLARPFGELTSHQRELNRVVNPSGRL